jgi:Fe-S cluster biosynthesis and repair protein YggX
MPGLSETEALSFLLLKQFASRLLPSSIEDDLEFYFKNASKALSENISKSAVRTWPSKVRIVETSIALQKPKNDPKVQKELYNALFRSKQVAITYVPAGREEGRPYSPINLLGLIEHGAVIYVVVNFASYEDIDYWLCIEYAKQRCSIRRPFIRMVLAWTITLRMEEWDLAGMARRYS